MLGIRLNMLIDETMLTCFDLRGAATVNLTENLTGQGSRLSYYPLYMRKYMENFPYALAMLTAIPTL